MAGFAALGQDAALLQHSSRGAAFGFQLAAVAVTVAIGAAGGTLGGFLVTAFDLVDQKLTAAQLFEDGTFWTVRVTTLVRWCMRTQAVLVLTRDPCNGGAMSYSSAFVQYATQSADPDSDPPVACTRPTSA